MQSNNERKINNCLFVATILYGIRIGLNIVCIWLNISPDNNVNVMGILFVCQNVLHWCCAYKIDNVALVTTNHILNRTYEIAEIAMYTMGRRCEYCLFLYSIHILIVFYFVGTRFQHTSYCLRVDKSLETKIDYEVFSLFFCSNLIFAPFNQNRNDLHVK